MPLLLPRLAHAAPLMLLLFGTGCVRLGCGDYNFQGTLTGEQCGPAGSFGFIYIDEGIATIYFEPYRELGDTESPLFHQAPYWNIDLSTDLLTSGEVAEMVFDSGEYPEILGYCSYFPQIGSGAGMITYLANYARIEIQKRTRRKNTGGIIYRVAWEVDCAIGTSQGNDLIELGLLSQGYEGKEWDWSPNKYAEGGP